MKVSQKILECHVRESNRIEGITAMQGNPLFDDHFNVAQKVVEGLISDPRYIHQILCGNIADIDGYAGKWRECGVSVGGRLMPRHECVPGLIHEWEKFCQIYRGSPTSKVTAGFLSAWFLCIHPFVDGNGRTARLIYNALRLQKNLEWHTVWYFQREEYYKYIWKVENRFSEWHPDVY